MPFKNSPSIYLDYHATTPIDPRVAEKVMAAMMTQLGNARSGDYLVGDRLTTEKVTIK